MSSAAPPADYPLLEQIRLLSTSVPLAACTHCRLVRSQDRGANYTLDLYEELSATPATALADNVAADNGDNLGNHVMRVVKCKKGGMPWHSGYDMYLSPSLLAGSLSSSSAATNLLPSASSGVLVGRVVPTTVGGVYTILQRSLSDDYCSSQPLLLDGGEDGESPQIQWQEVCAVQYHAHVLGSTGPREMTVVVHAVDDSGLPSVTDTCTTKSLIDRYRCGADTDPGIVPLINKPPIFISETASFALDFGPRVNTRSVKNFQLIHPHDKDYIVMQFGKSGPDSFALDIRFPMSPVMALGIAITSLDRKVIYNLSLPFFSSSDR
ncbi:Tubby- protein 2 [Coemansia sp. RSA 2424]|nr:Tubby- protein 2 [Coemansia sp. RSA 2424]